MEQSPPVLVTGAAGFVGMHVAARLSQDGYNVVACDNFNGYYSPALKRARAAHLREHFGIDVVDLDLVESDELERFFEQQKPGKIVHLAAQAGVRYSLTNPSAYISSNLLGFANILDLSHRYDVAHLVYASSSSVYGIDSRAPFRLDERCDQPVSLYAATKRANELLAYSYAHTHGLPVTGLRFFTVFGPWGRPDMAYFSFTKAMLEGRPIQLFADGRLTRDFTYIDDIVEGMSRIVSRAAPVANTAPPVRLYNIGSDRPIEVRELVRLLEGLVGRAAIIESVPAPATEVPATHADVSALERDYGFRPVVPLEVGLERFVTWYQGAVSAGII